MKKKNYHWRKTNDKPNILIFVKKSDFYSDKLFF